jgi:hypothetical protein
MGLAISMKDNFDIKKLNDEQYNEYLKYNIDDINATIELFKQKEETEKDLLTRLTICEMFNLPKQNIKNTYSKLCAIILKASPLKKQTESFKYVSPQFIKLKNETLKSRFENTQLSEETDLSFSHSIYENEIEYGLGGCHYGCNAKFVSDQTHRIIDIDFSSFYPHIMANDNNAELRYHSRAIKDFKSI